jgi:hypothetical protein
MPDDLPDPVRAFLGQAGEQVVLATGAAPRPSLPQVDRVDLPAISYAGKYDRVLVAVADRADLRAAVVPWAVRAPVVAVWIADLASSPGLVPRPEWPPLKAFRTQPMPGGYLAVARFDQPVRVANVVRELGRLAVWPAPEAAGGLIVDTGAGAVVPMEERDVPPDIVLGDRVDVLAAHEVTGRAPLAPGPLTGIGPLDERTLNPTGFEADVDGAVVALDSLIAGRPDDLRPTESLVRSLRPSRGVTGDRLDQPHAAPLVAGLSMAGVPLAVRSVAPVVVDLLGAAVVEALTAPVDLDDPVAREEHSVVLRRAALRTFSTEAWRRRMAALAGVRVAADPSVSVVLATRRSEMLGFALRQVARQRDVDLQLVLAPHGFSPDMAEVRELAGPNLADRVVLVPQDGAVLFGDVLARAVAAADGDLVLKMDDDDWYAPDFVSDLLLARSYSGAEMVGTPSEFHYLVPKDVTVRRGHRAEAYAHFVAGGTMLMDRGLLREVGSFRAVRRYVDAQLLQAFMRAGAAIYRAHGLGYLLRRNTTGHTWQVDMDYLLDPARVAEIRPGFAPSRLLEVDPADVPKGFTGRR